MSTMIHSGHVQGATPEMSGKILDTPLHCLDTRGSQIMALHSEVTHSEKPLRQPESRPKTVTLGDIAKVAGVTAMTVSRAIKGKSDVSPATRELVLRIAKELNYSANLSARALKTGRTGTIAVISGKLDQPYSANMVCLLEGQLNASGYQMKLLHSRGELSDLVSSANAAAVDGVIVAGMHHSVEELHLQMQQPTVFIGINKSESADYVFCDLGPAVRQGLEIMLHSGRKRIAYVGVGIVGEHLTRHDSEIRPQTYVSVMDQAGRTPEFISGAHSYDDPTPERLEIFKAYIQEHGCPDALLCVNDDIAIHVYRALIDLGIRIPDDTVLVGCDGLPITQFFEPPISTIAQPMPDMCATAWQFLQNRMNDPDLPLQTATFEAQLVVRRSLAS